MADPKIFELNNGTMQVKLSNFGCTITSLLVSDKDGKLADVVLGFDTLEPYLKGAAPYFGCIVGRVANRIKDGKFTLMVSSMHCPSTSYLTAFMVVTRDSTRSSGMLLNISRVIIHQLPSNIVAMMEKKAIQVTFLSPQLNYTLTSKTTMKLEMEGVPENKPTPINLAQHTYWNLAGHDSGNILDHTIQIWANHLTPVDENTIPTGEIMAVKGTPFDFTSENKIGALIHEVGIGYDHNYVLDCGDEKSGLKHAAKLKDLRSSRTLNLWTSAPGMQFYTANYVNGVVGKGGAVYDKHAAACLETHGFPNAINRERNTSIRCCLSFQPSRVLVPHLFSVFSIFLLIMKE